MLYNDCRSNICIEHATGIIEEDKAPENLSKKISSISLTGNDKKVMHVTYACFSLAEARTVLIALWLYLIMVIPFDWNDWVHTKWIMIHHQSAIYKYHKWPFHRCRQVSMYLVGFEQGPHSLGALASPLELGLIDLNITRLAF